MNKVRQFIPTCEYWNLAFIPLADLHYFINTHAEFSEKHIRDIFSLTSRKKRVHMLAKKYWMFLSWSQSWSNEKFRILNHVSGWKHSTQLQSKACSRIRIKLHMHPCLRSCLYFILVSIAFLKLHMIENRLNFHLRIRCRDRASLNFWWPVPVLVWKAQTGPNRSVYRQTDR